MSRTVAGSSLQKSLWPFLLRTDSTNNGSRVRTSIRIAAKSLPFLALVTAIAGVVTPLGLREEFTLLSERVATFAYIADDSPYGVATSPRGLLDFSRLCSQGPTPMMTGPRACPYSNSEVEWKENSTGIYWNIPDAYNTTVPALVREIYSSGTKDDGSTISNFFDIEWRQLTTRESEFTEGFGPYAVGNYRQLDSFILDNEYKVIEGLVVDARDGGIGFRNHTIPAALEHGGTWTEDLLFIEPTTACVNTNLSFAFKISTNSTDMGGVDQLRLIDQGGFSGLNQTYPQFDHPNAQQNPDLYGRAYKAAWMNNALSMIYMNVTNPRDTARDLEPFTYMTSQEGAEFPLGGIPDDEYTALSLSQTFGNYHHLPLSGNASSFSNPQSYSNPYKITGRNFTAASILCGGAGDGDFANLTNIYVGCGLLRGAPSRTDGGPAALQEHRSKWEAPLHACAATVRATIKTVTFTSNGTNSLQGLRVESIEPKKYPTDGDLPLWGLEESDFLLKDINLVWGLISHENESRENLTSVRQRHLHLPGYSTSTAAQIRTNSPTVDNLPAADFAQKVMNTVLDISEETWPFDLRGTASMSIFRRWQMLSPDPEKAAQVINLMWTDLAASAVVGTKGSLGQMNTGDHPASIQVRPIGRRITYDIRYGIPAFFLAALLALIVLVSLINTCFRKAGIGRLRRRIGQLSVGRVFTTFLYPEESTLVMSPGEWRRKNGKKTISVQVVAERGDGEAYVQYRGRGDVLTSPGEGTHVLSTRKQGYSPVSQSR
jgi:hypothetical protein